MLRLRFLGFFPVLSLGCLFLIVPGAAATPLSPFLDTTASTSLFYFEPCCSILNDGGPDAGNSSITNGSDSVAATSDPGAAGIGNFGPMGVSASVDDAANARASADYSDAWFCYGHCGETGVAIDLFLSVNGTASDVGDTGFIELDFDFTIAGSDLHFTYAQDADSGPPEAVATVNGTNISDVSARPVTLTQDPTTGNWSFALTLASTLTVCTLADICDSAGSVPTSGKGCTGGCPGPSYFTDESASLTIDAGGDLTTPLFLDASDPIGFTLASTDPDTEFFNSNGVVAPIVAAAAVPEPGSLVILGSGLAGFIWRRRHTKA